MNKTINITEADKVARILYVWMTRGQITHHKDYDDHDESFKRDFRELAQEIREELGLCKPGPLIQIRFAYKGVDYEFDYPQTNFEATQRLTDVLQFIRSQCIDGVELVGNMVWNDIKTDNEQKQPTGTLAQKEE